MIIHFDNASDNQPIASLRCYDPQKRSSGASDSILQLHSGAAGFLAVLPYCFVSAIIVFRSSVGYGKQPSRVAMLEGSCAVAILLPLV